MWQTRVTKMLGIKYPIIEGAYGGFGTSTLAAAVSEAGGLGMITAGALKTPQRLREDIRRARALTSKPLGVNLTIGMCPQIDEMREVAIEEGIKVVETAAYKADDHGKRLHEAGVVWIHKVANAKHALVAEEQGADAVVVVGLEGTGFKNISQLPTLIAIPWVVSRVKIPVIAAGGIGDGRGMMSALAMGAEAVYLATAFMATTECPISDKVKEMLVTADPTDPRFRDRNLNPPRREEFEKVMKERGTMPQGEWMRKLEHTLLKDSEQRRGSESDEFRAQGSLAVAVMNRVMTVKELIDGMVRDAEAIRQRWALSGPIAAA